MKVSIRNRFTDPLCALLVGAISDHQQNKVDYAEGKEQWHQKHIDVGLFEKDKEIDELSKSLKLLKAKCIKDHDSIIIVGEELQVLDDDQEEVEIDIHLCAGRGTSLLTSS